MPGITQYTEFRNGQYDKFGRQIGSVETTFLTGTYLDNGVERQINSVSVRERLAAYTEYRNGQLFAYRDRTTDSNGAVTEAWQLSASYDFKNRVLDYPRGVSQ
jgi:hypothetical protein